MTIENASGSKTDTKEGIVETNENYNFQLPIICDVDTLRMLIRKDGVRVVDVVKQKNTNKNTYLVQYHSRLHSY